MGTSKSKRLQKTQCSIDPSLGVWSIYEDAINNRNGTGAERIVRDYPDAFRQLCALVESGASDKTAAMALGVAESTLKRWLLDGENASTKSYRHAFWRGITMARSRAVAMAEIEVRKRKPHAWLTANAPDKWHADGPAINVDARTISFHESPTNADLARTLATLEQLGVIPTDHAAPRLAAPADAEPAPPGCIEPANDAADYDSADDN